MSSDKYTTRDLALAAVLKMNGYEIQNIEINGQDKAVLVFQRDERVQQLTDEYYARSMRVEPKEYSFALRDVKQALYEARNGKR